MSLFFLLFVAFVISDWTFLLGPTDYSEGNRLVNYGDSNTPNVYSSDISPGSRDESHAFYNVQNNTVIIFGGYGFDNYSTHEECTACLMDMWEYSIELNMWSYRVAIDREGSFCHLGDSVLLPYREGNAGKVIEEKTILMFGGKGIGIDLGTSEGYWNDIWSYDMQTRIWKRIKGEERTGVDSLYGEIGEFGENFTFSSRYKQYIFQLDQKPLVLYLWGGIFDEDKTSEQHYNELYAYDSTMNEFAYLGGGAPTKEEMSNISPEVGVYNETYFPMPRYYGSCYSYKDSLYVFRGYNFFMKKYALDMWIFNTTLNMWKLIMEISTNDAIGVTNEFSDSNKGGGRYYLNYWGFFDETQNDYYGIEANGWGEKEYDDLWAFSMNKNQFMHIYTNSLGSRPLDFKDPFSPCGLITSTSVVVNNTAYMFFGYGESESTSYTRFDIVYSFENFGVCDGLSSYHPDVCNSNGICKNSECVCDYGYTGEFCKNAHACGEVLFNSTDPLPCSGHGTCNPPECTCDENYFSDFCEIWSCGGILSNESNVCSGFGNCTDYDVCTCNKPYVVSENLTQCECLDGYYGDDCETYECYGILYSSSLVCSGSGQCIGPDNCSCNSGYSGNQCSVSFSNYVWIIVVAIIGVPCVLIIIVIFIVVGIVLIYNVLRVKEIENIVGGKNNLKMIQLEKEGAKKVNFQIQKNLFVIKEEEVELIKEIGEGGGNATVYQAKWKGLRVAFKVFKVHNILSNEDYYKDFEKELNVMSSLAHPNVLQFYGCSLDGVRVGMVIEFCQKGDLREYMINNPNIFNFNEKLRILSGISSAMEFLHSRSVIHRDLKPGNVLLDDANVPKLMDFGLSKVIKETEKKDMTSFAGTSWYMAPEVVKGVDYSFPCDVFSFGILTFEVIEENFNPFGNFVQNTRIETKIANDPSFRPEIADPSKYYLNKWIVSLMQKCWRDDSEKRPTFTDICKELSNNYQRASGESRKTKLLNDAPKTMSLGSFGEKKSNNLDAPPKSTPNQSAFKNIDFI